MQANKHQHRLGFTISQTEANARYRKYLQDKKYDDGSNANDVESFCLAMEKITSTTAQFSFEDILRSTRDTVPKEKTKEFFYKSWLPAMLSLSKIEEIDSIYGHPIYLVI